MESITFTITNELAMISVLQAAAAVYVRTAGGDEIIVCQTELVIEEIVSNIIQHEYMPGQHDTITLTLLMQEGVLELLIRFQGIPFDVNYLRKFEKTSLSEIIVNSGRGFGMHLLGQFSDEVQYNNMGWKGQEIRIRRFLCEAEMGKPQREKSPHEKESPVTPSRIIIRRMHPDEAATVSKLAYFAYRYTYFKEEIYDPEEVRQRNEDGRMISYVAVNEENGEIIGHTAMIHDDLTDMPELAAAFVNPHYRRNGSLNSLTDCMIQDAQKGWNGTFGTAVTSHHYSQLTAVRMGMRESALLVSRVQSLDFKAITDHAVNRESLMYLIRLFDLSSRKPYYPPIHHAEMIEKIICNVNMAVCFSERPEVIPLAVQGETETRTDAYGAGHVVLRRWGRDTLSEVRTIQRSWCLDRMETIYLYLPLTQPSTAVFCSAIENMGFFFSGIIPGSLSEDWLVLQYLNNQRYDYGMVKSATSFGQELIDYVRACDPVASVG
ncbi:MAG: hypothetical protein CSYNP_02009 [Syntrophus sp. SKADARSKE-3]|nr:hypothetical protein [Syntrophus sp. SKADARSKE-3]